MKNKFVINSFSYIFFQLICIIYGIVLPKLMLVAYGSELYGLVSSINQFLGIIALSEFGMTAVIQASLYEPLLNNNYKLINQILTSANKFFRNIGKVFSLYICILCIVFPYITKSTVSSAYIIGLVLIMSINTLAEYFWGLTNNQLIAANQEIYFTYFVRSVLLIISAGISIFCVIDGISLIFMKLIAAFIILINPLLSSIFVKLKYPLINKNTEYESEPIKQKWNGIAQHLSSYVYSNTDIIILTFFSDLKSISVYAIYNIILSGLKQITIIFDNAVKPILGRIWAKQEYERASNYFELYKLVANIIYIIIFGTCSNVIVGFVLLYTSGINDVNYNVPLFAFIFTLSSMFQNIKNIYHTFIQSIGNFRETQSGYYIAVIINLSITICLVGKYGILGVVFGTLVATIYHLLYLIKYVQMSALKSGITNDIKIFVSNLIVFGMAYSISSNIASTGESYVSWFVSAIKIFFVWFFVTLGVNIFSQFEKIRWFFEFYRQRKKSRK